MTSESFEWLNDNVVMGFGEKYGKTWWPRDDRFNNLYPGAIPMERVLEFFGRWRPVMADVLFETEDGKLIGDSEGAMVYYRHQPDSPLHGTRLGIHSGKYAQHDRVKWLVDNVSTMLDGDIAIASIGELNKGRKAWVQIESPETITHSSGESFRPFIAAMTSFDGSLATTYKEGDTRVQCDNTLEMFFTEAGKAVRQKHTKNSEAKFSIQVVRERLDLHIATYVAGLDELLATTVSGTQWGKFLDGYVPLVDTNGDDKTGKGRTQAENKRMDLETLYHSDNRVAPWTGTAWGVLQSVNTWNTHFATVKNADSRLERQWDNFLTGKTSKADGEAKKILDSVLA